MTKAQRILELYDGRRTTREIADVVGCRPEYVRVVARQRKGTRQSEIDQRYLSSSLGQATVRKCYPAIYAYMDAKRSGKSREEARAAYRAKRAEASNAS